MKFPGRRANEGINFKLKFTLLAQHYFVLGKEYIHAIPHWHRQPWQGGRPAMTVGPVTVTNRIIMPCSAITVALMTVTGSDDHPLA